MGIVIEIKTEIWGKEVTVELSQVPHSGGVWHLYVNRFWWAKFVDYDTRWKCLPHRPHWWFTMADMRILEDMIEEVQPAKSVPASTYDHLYPPHALRPWLK